MPYRLLCAAALAILAVPGPATALIVEGTFSGTAQASANGGVPATPRDPLAYDGAAVTGSFRLNIPTEPWDEGSGVAPPFGEIRFSLLGETFAFLAGPDWPDNPGVVSIGTEPLQSVTFQTSYRPRFDGASITFGSAANRLFDPSDFSTLTLDANTVSRMDASFAASSASLAVSVDIDHFGFGSVSAPIDEPPALLMLGAGWVAVAGWRARKPRRQAGLAASAAA